MITFPNLSINDDSYAVSSQYKSDARFSYGLITLLTSCFSNILFLSIPYEGYSRNVSCAPT